jgi:hypothetical protein
MTDLLVRGAAQDAVGSGFGVHRLRVNLHKLASKAREEVQVSWRGSPSTVHGSELGRTLHDDDARAPAAVLAPDGARLTDRPRTHARWLARYRVPYQRRQGSVLVR